MTTNTNYKAGVVPLQENKYLVLMDETGGVGKRLKIPDFNKPAFRMLPESVELIKQGKCPQCFKSIKGFRDELSEREYSISGICQLCQDVARVRIGSGR